MPWFVRGNDGLTDRQRRKYAKRWNNGAGRRMTHAEVAEIGRIARLQQQPVAVPEEALVVRYMDGPEERSAS